MNVRACMRAVVHVCAPVMDHQNSDCCCAQGHQQDWEDAVRSGNIAEIQRLVDQGFDMKTLVDVRIHKRLADSCVVKTEHATDVLTLATFEARSRVSA